MGFSKSYAKSSDKSVYPKWVEIKLNFEEEKEAINICREKNLEIMNECINDARIIAKENKLFESQQGIIKIATSLFDKRASHEVFFKEQKTKEKFDLLENNE